MSPSVELESPTSAIRMPSVATRQTGSSFVPLAGSPPNAGNRVVTGPNLKSGPGTRPRAASKSGGGGGGLKFLLAAAAGVFAVASFGPQFGVRVPYVSDFLDSSTGAPKKSNGRQTASENAPGSAAPAAPPVARAVAQAPKGIKVVLNVLGSDASAKILIAGNPVDPNAPEAVVPFDTALEISIERPNYKPFKKQFVLESTQLKDNPQYVMDVRLEPVKFGTVSIKSTPSAEATIIAAAGGKSYAVQTPVGDLMLEPGTYSIQLLNSVLGMSKSVKVVVVEGKSVNLEEKLDINR